MRKGYLEPVRLVLKIHLRGSSESLKYLVLSEFCLELESPLLAG